MRVGFDMERLPASLHLDANGLKRAVSAIQWMRQDATYADGQRPQTSRARTTASTESFEDLQSHLRYAFYALVSWLAISYQDQSHYDQRSHQTLRRFHIFKGLVEEHLVKWRSVSTYAAEMGCTERSLTRSALEAEGISAKEYISRRLGLEAKRLLIHTDCPIGVIAEKLGFKEATHFSKFFRRVAGCTPQRFRLVNGRG